MLEKLNGRLMWERTPQGGIRVEIPARLDWAVVAMGFVVALWALLCMSLAPLGLLMRDAPGIAAWFFTLCFLALACAALVLLAWNFKGKTTLTLDPAEMKLVRHVMGVEWNTRVFQTREVRNLRYLPSSGYKLGRTFIPSVFCFESGERTHAFASGATDIEAFALIDRMLGVHEFPRERAVDYIGVRR
jgi:hypothetical protein